MGCGSSSDKPQKKKVGELFDHKVACADVRGGFPHRTGGSELPASLRGVFWLTSQKKSSSLMTFAESGSSGGPLKKHEKGAETEIKVYGDQSWSFADDGRNWNLCKKLELAYRFTFDDLENPTFAQIHPSTNSLGQQTEKSEWFLDFEMTLLKEGDEDVGQSKYPGSVVWRRDSKVLGQELESVMYLLVQVIDGNGELIKAAHGQWMEYNQQQEQGDDPGMLWIRSSNKEKVCDYNSRS